MALIREWLMQLIAGKRPYWISDRAKARFSDIPANAPKTLVQGACLAMCHCLDEAEATRLTVELSGTMGKYTVTVERVEAGE